MCVVSQNTFLFNDSIRNNIRYSNPNATEEEIIEAAKKAGAYEFIMAQENGFKTKIGEIGKKLSGGEKQKISICRAFLKKSNIIIMDEIMTHLDHQSKENLNELLIKEYSNKTCITITHKFFESKNIDKIIILQNGRIKDIQEVCC